MKRGLKVKKIHPRHLALLGSTNPAGWGVGANDNGIPWGYPKRGDWMAILAYHESRI